MAWIVRAVYRGNPIPIEKIVGAKGGKLFKHRIRLLDQFGVFQNQIEVKGEEITQGVGTAEGDNGDHPRTADHADGFGESGGVQHVHCLLEVPQIVVQHLVDDPLFLR